MCHNFVTVHLLLLRFKVVIVLLIIVAVSLGVILSRDDSAGR